MSELHTRYDVVVIGGGHNGLVSACYLSKAGLSVLVLERDESLGGATRSQRVFAGQDAKLSVYSYLISLFPEKIVADLGLKLGLKSRRTSSWTPSNAEGKWRELLIRNGDPEHNRRAFHELTGSDEDYRGYGALGEMQAQLADLLWPSLTEPLVSREEMRGRLDINGRRAWQALIEEPLGEVIEECIADDLIRGVVFTDAKIGVPTYPHDPSLIQNRCFLYHVIGRGSGEWCVPIGGMGVLVDELLRVARSTGRVHFATSGRVRHVEPASSLSSIEFEIGGRAERVDCEYVLCNASAQVLGQLTDTPLVTVPVVEGTGFKINMLLERLPRLRSEHCDANEAFAGTVHIDEGYAQMVASYRESMAGQMPAQPPGEIYCHSLTDDSILSQELRQRGCHTLTLFGLDMPYRLFEEDCEGARDEALRRYLHGIDQFLEEPIADCLAVDADGRPCVEAMSAFDLERKIHLPKGNIFHGDITWPFVESSDEAGLWGVETAHPNVLLCGSAAKRGGAVSGIPGHNAAMKVLESAGLRRPSRS